MSWINVEIQNTLTDVLDPKIKNVMQSSVRDSLYQIQNKWKKDIQSKTNLSNVSYPVSIVYPADSEGFEGTVELTIKFSDIQNTSKAPLANSEIVRLNNNRWNVTSNVITPLGMSRVNQQLNVSNKHLKNPGLQRIINGYQPKKKSTIDPLKWLNKALQNIQNTEEMIKFAQSTVTRLLNEQLNGIGNVPNGIQ